jgi:hypothetical protein
MVLHSFVPFAKPTSYSSLSFDVMIGIFPKTKCQDEKRVILTQLIFPKILDDFVNTIRPHEQFTMRNKSV